MFRSVMLLATLDTMAGGGTARSLILRTVRKVAVWARNKERAVQTRQKFSIGYFLVAIGAILFLQWLLAPHALQVSYSQFKTHLAAGQVERVVVSDTMIHGVCARCGVSQGATRTWGHL